MKVRDKSKLLILELSYCTMLWEDAKAEAPEYYDHYETEFNSHIIGCHKILNKIINDATECIAIKEEIFNNTNKIKKSKRKGKKNKK